MVAPIVSNYPALTTVTETSLATSKPALIDSVLIEQISQAAQGIFKTASPQIVIHVNTVVDLGLTAFEASAKVAINAKVAAVVPCIAPVLSPCVNSGIDLAGKEARTALHDQVDECITSRGPLVVDACIKSSGGLINSSYAKACP